MQSRKRKGTANWPNGWLGAEKLSEEEKTMMAPKMGMARVEVETILTQKGRVGRGPVVGDITHPCVCVCVRVYIYHVVMSI